MSNTKSPSLLARIERTMQLTVRSIRAAINAKAVVVVVVHQDGMKQCSAGMSPEATQVTVLALREVATKIERGEGVLEMNGEVKN